MLASILLCMLACNCEWETMKVNVPEGIHYKPVYSFVNGKTVVTYMPVWRPEHQESYPYCVETK